MATRVDPKLLPELKEFGAVNIEKCFNCGNCTAICPLTDSDYPFPRDMIRLVQLGLENRLASSLDPWLCYYCGDCSETCPKEAEPGEMMMAARRWLTAKYDWTGLSKRLYTSNIWSVGALILGALIVVLLAFLLHGPLITNQVALNTFAPVEMMHTADLILAGVLGFFLLSNLFHMFYLNFLSGKGASLPPLSVFLSEGWRLIYHAITQQRFSECGGNNRRWISHLVLVFGYGTMFVLIVVFLTWFQTDQIHPLYHPQRLLGYLAALAIIYGAGDALIGRITKRETMHKFSHLSDWLFPILLILLSVSGLLISAFRISNHPMATYYTYVAHLVVMMMMYICIGPMGKWAHLLYRPFAVFFQAVKEKAREMKQVEAASAASAS